MRFDRIEREISKVERMVLGVADKHEEANKRLDRMTTTQYKIQEDAKKREHEVEGKFEKVISTVNKIIKEAQRTNKVKVDITDHQALVERLDAFSELEHMSYLKETLIPRIEKFNKNCDGYHV